MRHSEETYSIGERIAEHAAHLDAATHRLLTDLRSFDEAGGWYHQGFKSFGGWLAWRVGWDPITAREHVRVALKLGGLPLTDEALRRGELSYSKLRAMTRVATPANEAALLEQARYSTGAQLERICKRYAAVMRHDEGVQPADDEQRRYVKRSDTADGMVKLEAILHPEEAAIVWAALEKIATERCLERRPEPNASETASSMESSVADAYAESSAGASAESSVAGASAESCAAGGASAESSNVAAASAESSGRGPVKPFDRAEALIAMAQDILRGTRKDRAPTDLVVTVTADSLVRRDDSVDVGVVADGTCISADGVRRLGCDCGVLDVVEDDRGSPLSIGRKRRTIPAAMKRALLRRDQTCRFPGCTTRVFLEGHHLKHWADGGATHLKNLLSLCSHHHRYVHEYGFTISLSCDAASHDLSRRAELLFLDRLGRPVREVPERTPAEDLGWPATLERNALLGITSETSAHGWDGTRVDYQACVDALLEPTDSEGAVDPCVQLRAI